MGHSFIILSSLSLTEKEQCSVLEHLPKFLKALENKIKQSKAKLIKLDTVLKQKASSLF